ncbi:MAG: tetratricopeptide repeat protein [Acidobacteriia bacterium]|nr:tetratricopeptide repeat protein [Terriglobia bacterium]
MSRTSTAGKLILALAWIGILAGQQAALDEAAAAFEQGRAAEAGQKLDSILKDHPADLRALILKGAVLDSLQRYAEAESYYQRALKLAPGSAQVLNNAANHYLSSGDRRRARELYRKAIAIEPRHVNANLQLAQMSVDDKHGAEALTYLSRLGDSANSDAGALLLRARALALAGQCADATNLLGKLEAQPAAGPGLFFSSGMAFAECKQYDQAETSFSRALDADPRDFDVLYNLGLAALGADHRDRATSVLETALHERPDDADCLYALARAYIKQERLVDATALLTRAQKLTPGRADVLLLLAQVSARLQFYKDSVEAYDTYLKLKPDDDIARRERGFSLACANQFKTALPDLESYVRKHPLDAVGFYELSIAQAFEDRGRAVQSLDHALALDPELAPARYSRALLNMEEDKPALAVDDLQFFVARKPDDYRALAQLGKAYLALDRAGEAAEVLKRAADLAPNEPLVLVPYRRALVKLGRSQDGAAILSRLKQAGSPEGPRPQSGLIDYLSLSPAAQSARYLANLRKNADANPGDLQWKLRLGRELLAEGKTSEGMEVFNQLKSSSSDPSILAASGRILLGFEEYERARQFLEPAVAANASLSSARLDLAIARFHLQGAQVALLELDKTPAADRKGDYYLLRAQILDAQGKVQEAAEALNQGIREAPTQSALYLQASGFLLKHQLYEKALALLEQASRILPDDRDLLLAQAVTLAVTPRDDDAQKLLAKIQARWPEWNRPYLLNGMILEIQLKSAEALPLLETAIALGANTPEGFYYQALATTHARPDDLESARQAIDRALALTSNDPYIFLLAGKISLARKDYQAAVRQLAQSTHLLPTLIPAHYALHDAYKAIGDEQKSAAELEAIQHIADENAASDKSPFPVEDFVFRVRPPG